MSCRLGAEQVVFDKATRIEQCMELIEMLHRPLDMPDHHPGEVHAGRLQYVENLAWRTRMATWMDRQTAIQLALGHARSAQHSRLSRVQRPRATNFADDPRPHAGVGVAVTHLPLHVATQVVFGHGGDACWMGYRDVIPGAHHDVQTSGAGNANKRGWIAADPGQRAVDQTLTASQAE